jgi:hypothetical protein
MRYIIIKTIALGLVTVPVGIVLGQAILGYFPPHRHPLSVPGGHASPTITVSVPHDPEGMARLGAESLAEMMQQPIGPNFQGMWSSGLMTVTAEGDGWLSIAARFAVVNNEPNVRLVWSLRIYEDSKRRLLLKEHHYEESAIHLVELPWRGYPEFHDRIHLAPGAYRLELRLYGALPGQRLDRLPFGANIKDQTFGGVSDIKRISL